MQKIELLSKELYFYQNIFDEIKLKHFFNTFLNTIQWKQEFISIGKNTFLQPRLTSWYGDKNSSYTYSGLTLVPKPWTNELRELKQKIESIVEADFNSVLLNLYRNGNDSMGWHSDAEASLGNYPTIASFSLGVSRKFILKHKKMKKERIELHLKNGDLLLMKGSIQNSWKHNVPKSVMIKDKRINLTFRKIIC